MRTEQFLLHFMSFEDKDHFPFVSSYSQPLTVCGKQEDLTKYLGKDEVIMACGKGRFYFLLVTRSYPECFYTSLFELPSQ